MLPVFTGEDCLQVTWEAYSITTAIVHLGEHTCAGHYRTAFFLRGSDTVWYSDDNQPAEVLPQITTEISENCYILGCLHRSAEGV